MSILKFSNLVAFDIRYGLYLVIFSMPFYLVRFSIVGIPTTMLESMIYALFIWWIAVEARSEKRFEKISEVFCKEKKLFFGVALLFAGLLIATAFSSDVRTSLGIVKGWFFDPFLVFLVFISCIKNDKDMKYALLSWALSGFAVAIVAIGYYFSGDLTFDGRLKAFYLSPNHLAMYLAPVLLISIWFLKKKEGSFLKDIEKGTKFPIRSLALLAILISMIPLSFAHSYGALLGISAAIFCLFGKCVSGEIDPKRRRYYMIVATVVLLFFMAAGYNKANQIYDSSGRSSLHSRLMIWEASWEMIKESPVVGIGPGTFQEKYLSLAKDRTEPYLEWAVPQPHNIFIAFYLQAGLFGFAGFILILIWFFQVNWKNDKKNIQYQISNISACLMVYTLIHGLIDTTYWKNDLSLMFWLLLAMAIYAKHDQSKQKKQSDPGYF